MKIHILFSFKKSSWGGGNQFLKALKIYLLSIDVYEKDSKKADVILFNSHHKLETLLTLKKKKSNQLFIHRVDGPLVKYRSGNFKIDKLIYLINNQIADGTIFQSKWSKKENYKLGIKHKTFETTIINAPDKKKFNKKKKKEFSKGKKIKIIATSWSGNWNKGFDIYQYLDNNINFSKYEFTFIGNSPIQFRNIKHIKPLSSYELAEHLKKHDIFITASKNDPCSNSLIEALHCGLPTIALNSGGHPEIIGKGGILFNKKTEIIEKIEKITNNYEHYQKMIKLPSINQVGESYYKFILSTFNQYNKKKLQKKLNKFNYYKLLLYIYFLKIENIILNRIKRK